MKFNGKWLKEEMVNSYKQTCLRLSKDLTNFKRDSGYIGIVGNDTRPQTTVMKFIEAVRDMPYCEKNDLIGNPMLHYGMSAATLRFMKVVKDIDFEYKSVIELGGGYGGQCLVMKHYRKADYTIIDLPEALELSKAYLKANDVECNFISSDNVQKLSADLLISDYCITEFDKEGIDFYLNNIEFKYGYFTGLGNWEYLISKLKPKYNLIVLNEIPATSRHRNKVIIARSLLCNG